MATQQDEDWLIREFSRQIVDLVAKEQGTELLQDLKNQISITARSEISSLKQVLNDISATGKQMSAEIANLNARMPKSDALLRQFPNQQQNQLDLKRLIEAIDKKLTDLHEKTINSPSATADKGSIPPHESWRSRALHFYARLPSAKSCTLFSTGIVIGVFISAAYFARQDQLSQPRATGVQTKAPARAAESRASETMSGSNKTRTVAPPDGSSTSESATANKIPTVPPAVVRILATPVSPSLCRDIRNPTLGQCIELQTGTPFMYNLRSLPDLAREIWTVSDSRWRNQLAVAALQAIVILSSKSAIPVDGAWGPKTRTSLRELTCARHSRALAQLTADTALKETELYKALSEVLTGCEASVAKSPP